MVASVAEWKWHAASVGFTFGFGLLTTWTAIQQSYSIKAPLKSIYILLVWGELISNIVIALVAVLSLDTLSVQRVPSVPIYGLIIIFSTCQTQFYLQIIIDRAFLMAPTKQQLTRTKWGIGISMTIFQCLVLALWYPAALHIAPFRVILKYLNPGMKAVFLVVDILLNYWFVRVVQRCLEKKPERYEYASACRFNLFLIFVGLILDCFLIGFPSLRNPTLYLQLHPLVFTIKLNIEMSLANLVARLARGSDFDENWSFIPSTDFSTPKSGKVLLRNDILYQHSATFFLPVPRPVRSVVTAASNTEVAATRERISGLRATKDVVVTVEEYGGIDSSSSERWKPGTRRVQPRRRRSEASLEGRALQTWYSHEGSALGLDTKIFDNLPEQGRR